jgi:outer membrane lipoprotein-sorting protein
VKPERACDALRIEISARLDGEVDAATDARIEEHLSTCEACRAHERALAHVRQSLRLQVVEEVPDLTDAILEQVARRGPRERLRTEWTTRLRIGSVAAAAAALLLIGTSIPFTDRAPEVASASEIVRQVRAAARTLSSYRATFEIVERGWHRDVDGRRFTAEVLFSAPERFRLSMRDHTTYPARGNWPHNDVDLVADAERWWIEEPSSCPTGALPRCRPKKAIERRVVVRRQPFDGSSALPTDIVVPLETIASSGALQVEGQDEVIGRSAYRVSLDYRRAVPLVSALQAGGVWRDFHPLDRVDIWIDRDTWFPLRFQVRAGSSPERPLWARRLGYREEAGSVLLQVSATSFSASPEIPSETFRAPRTGIVVDGGFAASSVAEVPPRVTPALTAGLSPYRAGRTAQGQWIVAYASGTTWLKVVSGRDVAGSAARAATLEQVRLNDGGYAYYQPAASTAGRRVDLFGDGRRVYLESNLARRELLAVASSLPGTSIKLPARIEGGGGLVLVRVSIKDAVSLPFSTAPRRLPEGYAPSAAVLARTGDDRPTVTLYYRNPEAEYDGFGIRVTIAPGVGRLAPSSQQYEVIALGGGSARWSQEEGVLEWVRDRVYRAVAAPSFDLATAVWIARGLDR